jgi:bifunctional non-homologous end joining protein LigD
MPAVAPMMASAGTLPPGDADALFGYEVKWDGVRAVGYVGADRFCLVSRNGRDITAQYPELAPPAHLAHGGGLVVDGEIVAFDEQGRPSFAALQPRMHVRDALRISRYSERGTLVYIVFDVLRHEGRDVTMYGYRERRALLDSLGVEAAPGWRAPACRVGGGAQLYAATRDAGLEGVIAKRLDSVYRPGHRSRDWIKIKHLLTQEVVVGGWTSGEGRRRGGVGALVLGVPGAVAGPGGGRRVGGRRAALRYVGRVGTGFTDRFLADLGGLLARLASDRSPFAGRVPPEIERSAHWVRPVLVGEVAYAERTRDGLLRAPAWRGLRPDKAAGDVRPE